MPPEVISIAAAADRQIVDVFDPFIVGDVNESQVKVAKFGETFDWHTHAAEDEAFLVLRGRIAIDFRDGTVELGDGDFIVVPRAVEHRPRSLTREPLVLMIEPASTINTGDMVSDRTVKDLKRLSPS
ncbi:MAG: cupin domain-containing protein [Pseudomonadota bacterium]